jgi:hypothetical protein
LLLILLGCSIALGLAEVVVRLFASQQLILLRPDIWQPLDSLGWAKRPNVRALVNTGDRTVTLVTDGRGFRVGAFPRPGVGYRILLLGDSFMEALQVEYEQSLAGLIEQCFSDGAGRGAIVSNTGVGGWDPPQYFLQARRSLAQEPFDIVVVAVFLGNDIVTRRRILPPRQPEARHKLRIPRSLLWGEFVDAVFAPVNDGLETRSHLFIFLKNRFQGLLMRAHLTALEVPSELLRSEAESSRWSVTADILAEIDSMSTAAGIPALFALIPSIEEVDPEVFRHRAQAFGIDLSTVDLEQPVRLMTAELERRGLRYVSLLQPLRDARSRGVVLYGRADPHPSAEGHRVMWGAIAPMLAEALGVPNHVPGSLSPECNAP